MPLPIHIINGPNLNLLGTREPEIYGTTTLADIETACQQKAHALGRSILFRQSNHEGELVDWIQEARTGASGGASGLILNAGAYSHTSVAILDALQSLTIPIIEVHLSNIFAREEFRHHSFVSGVAKGVICGLGAQGYVLALEAMASLK